MLISGSKPASPKIIGDDIFVGSPIRSYYEMQSKWHLVEALRGGTEAMRKIPEYLPQEPKESEEAYKVRVRRTFLYNLYWRTITAITGLAFIKPVVISNVPKALEYLEFNFDGTGRSITEVAYDMTIDCLHYGKTHLLADFPVTQESRNLLDFRRSNYRPYMNHINPTRLIGWEVNDGAGIPSLANVRIIEHKTEKSTTNIWAEKDVYYVRVIYNDRIEVYRYDPEIDSNYELYETPTINTLGYIPLSTAYGNKTGYMTAEPALYDLAQINLRHWQSSSDQNNILHIARVPFMLASGFEEGELNNAEIGVNRMIVSSNEQAKIAYIEHNGAAIQAGRTDLRDLEQQMATLGADLLISKGVSRQTATARRLDQNESMSTLQMALRSVEQAIETAYQSAGAWIGIDASKVSVSIGDDLSVSNEPNPTNALIALLDSGLITDEQAVEEGKRQGILSSYFKLDKKRPRQLRDALSEATNKKGSSNKKSTNEGEQDSPSNGEENDHVEQSENQ